MNSSASPSSRPTGPHQPIHVCDKADKKGSGIVDPPKRTIDLKQGSDKDKTSLGIYKVSEDNKTLVICLAEPEG